MPVQTVSDRGTQFNSTMLRALYKQLGIEPTMSTAFHPQTDGQTERLNQTIEQYLRFYTAHRQDDWTDHLALAEFTYNNSVHASTGVSPFFASKGYHPTFTTRPSTSQSPAADEIAARLLEVRSELQAAMSMAQERQAYWYDRRRQSAGEWEVGDKVWLETKNLALQRASRKLGPKRLGPSLSSQRLAHMRSDSVYRLR